MFLFPFSAYGNREKWERSLRVGFAWWRGVGAKLFAFLISRLGCSAPAVAHMLPARPRGCPLSRILRSTVSRPPQHQINVKYRLWYLSVIIVAYLFDIPSLVCSLLSLFAAVSGKIKERRKSFEMNFLQIRTTEVQWGNKIIQISQDTLFFIRQRCVFKACRQKYKTGFWLDVTKFSLFFRVLVSRFFQKSVIRSCWFHSVFQEITEKCVGGSSIHMNQKVQLEPLRPVLLRLLHLLCRFNTETKLPGRIFPHLSPLPPPLIRLEGNRFFSKLQALNRIETS